MKKFFIVQIFFLMITVCGYTIGKNSFAYESYPYEQSNRNYVSCPHCGGTYPSSVDTINNRTVYTCPYCNRPFTLSQCASIPSVPQQIMPSKNTLYQPSYIGNKGNTIIQTPGSREIINNYYSLNNCSDPNWWYCGPRSSTEIIYRTNPRGYGYYRGGRGNNWSLGIGWGYSQNWYCAPTYRICHHRHRGYCRH